MSSFLQPHELQHARLPCPSPSLGVCSHSCPLSRWCHPTISSSVVTFNADPNLQWKEHCDLSTLNQNLYHSHLLSGWKCHDSLCPIQWKILCPVSTKPAWGYDPGVWVAWRGGICAVTTGKCGQASWVFATSHRAQQKQTDSEAKAQEGVGHAWPLLFSWVLSLKLYLVSYNFLMGCKCANGSRVNTLFI